MIWITRSQPGADRLLQACQQAGYQAIAEPVLEIVELAPPRSRVRMGPVPGFELVFEWAIFVSEHAVTLGLPRLELSQLQQTHLLAVGAQTQSALHEHGLVAAMGTTANSEGLLALPDLQQLQGARILLVSGQGGRDLLVNTLQERGAVVTEMIVYQRRPVLEINLPWQQIQRIVVSSGDGFQAASRLWFGAANRSEDLASIPVLVPSKRVLTMAEEMGFARVHNGGGADNDSVLRGLAAMRNW